MGQPLRQTLAEFAWIFVAGGTGATLRVVLATTLDKHLHEWFPFIGTLVVNLLGCVAIGLCSALLGAGPLRPVILGGLLGGFTTYSAFGMLSWELLRSGRTVMFAVQVGAHVVGGILGVGLGLWLGRPSDRLP